jgi:hypothetical protein
LHNAIDLEFGAPKKDTLGFRISEIPTLDFKTSTRTVTLDEAEKYILNLPKTDPDFLGFNPPKYGDDYSTLKFPSPKTSSNYEREVRFHFGKLRKSYEGNPRFLIGVNRSCFLYDGEGGVKQGNAYTILPAN